MARLRQVLAAASLAILTAGSAAGCTSGGGGGGGGGNGQGNQGAGQTAAPTTPAPSWTVTPADQAADVPVSAEVVIQGGKLSTVEMTDDAGTAVEGALRADGTSWVPSEPLDYSTTYKVTANADNATRKITFTTMARPGNRLRAHVYMGDNKVYGQAMPIVVEFDQPGIATADQAAVQRRLFVTSDPPQEGAWHWDNKIQLEYRPKVYWQPGTKLNIRLGLGGHPLGGGRFGLQDITIKSSIDTVRRVIEVDNGTKRMVARQDGRPVRVMPVSLGKPSKPSFSGNMVIMDRLKETVFDSSTYGTPVNSADGYRTKVQFAERLTWDGQFIHSAPWSVAQQGRTNVSHGCVNAAPKDAEFVYNFVKIGDPVVVKGTGVKLNQGNGWTVWDLSWEVIAEGG